MFTKHSISDCKSTVNYNIPCSYIDATVCSSKV